MARFYLMMSEQYGKEIGWYEPDMKGLSESDKDMLTQLNTAITSVDDLLSKFRFAEAGDTIYHFMWDSVAAKYLEEVKGREDLGVALSILRHIILTGLKLLHPFMPFVTEAIWKEMPKEKEEMLIGAKWPTVN